MDVTSNRYSRWANGRSGRGSLAAGAAASEEVSFITVPANYGNRTSTQDRGETDRGDLSPTGAPHARDLPDSATSQPSAGGRAGPAEAPWSCGRDGGARPAARAARGH